MILYNVNSYNEIGPKPARTNYVVRSSLDRGQATIHSLSISAKLVLTGSEMYQSSDSRFSVGPDQFLLTTPDESFDLTVAASAKGCCFYFEPGYVNSLLSECLSEDLEGGDVAVPSIKTTRLPVRSCSFGLSMYSIAKSATDIDVDLLSAHLAESIVNLSHLSKSLPFKRDSTRQELLARLEIARTFIVDARNESISLADIESAACLSRFHLIRLFTRVYGVPPLRFHQNLKLDTAQEQLKAGVPQKVIAEALGFSTVSSFSRAYRRRHNRTPSEDQ